MKMMYVITEGGGFKSSAVFDKKELAEKFIGLFENSFDEFRIEEYVLNPYEKETNGGYNPFFLRMNKDGDCYEIKKSEYVSDFKNEKMVFGFCMHGDLYISVFAKDEKHAIKIANEKRIELIANNKWNK